MSIWLSTMPLSRWNIRKLAPPRQESHPQHQSLMTMNAAQAQSSSSCSSCSSSWRSITPFSPPPGEYWPLFNGIKALGHQDDSGHKGVYNDDDDGSLGEGFLPYSQVQMISLSSLQVHQHQPGNISRQVHPPKRRFRD